MAQTIRRTFSGPHPTKVNRGYWKPGEPLACHAQTTTVVGDGRLAISMNGTAVMTLAEFREWASEIQNALVGL